MATAQPNWGNSSAEIPSSQVCQINNEADQVGLVLWNILLEKIKYC